jgi:hypothetical protein
MAFLVVFLAVFLAAVFLATFFLAGISFPPRGPFSSEMDGRTDKLRRNYLCGSIPSRKAGSLFLVGTTSTASGIDLDRSGARAPDAALAVRRRASRHRA